MIEEQIKLALQTAARVAIGTDYPIQALGRTLKPEQKSNGKWIEFVQIVNNPPGMAWDDSKLYQGIFRIMLHWPLNDEGDYEPARYLDALSTFFKNGTLLREGDVTVKIYQNPDAGSAIPASGEQIFPLSLSYRCFDPSN